MADGTPTAGCSDDAAHTEKTFANTATGTPGVATADGKVIVGREGEDRGPASPDTPLDVVDSRLIESLRHNLSGLYFVLDGIYGLMRIDGIRAPKSRAATIGGVAASLTSGLIIPADGSRLSLDGMNDTSSGILYLRCGSGVASSGQGGYSVIVNPGDYWEAKPEQVQLAWVGVWNTATGFFNWTGTS